MRQPATVTEGELWAEVERVAAAEGVSMPVATMRVMTVTVMGFAGAVPPSLRGGLVDACGRWFADRGAQPLEGARVAAWQFLRAKNGDSGTVADRTDAVVRCLICVLWDEAHVTGLDLAVEAFVGFANRAGATDGG